MKLSAPTVISWVITLIIAVVAILLKYDVIKVAALNPYDFVLLTVAFVWLSAATLLKGL